MLDRLLAALTHYGYPALFVVVAIAASAFRARYAAADCHRLARGTGLDQRLAAIVIAVCGFRGRRPDWLCGWPLGWQERWSPDSAGMLGNAERIRKLDARARSWGGAGVFFSRWLVTPLGPWINLASGAAAYSWLRFTLWDFLGESFGAVALHMARLCFQRPCSAGRRDFRRLTWAIVGVAGRRNSWLEAVLHASAHGEKRSGSFKDSSVTARILLEP